MGNPLRFHGGTITLRDGTLRTRHVILGATEGHDGNVYVLAHQPYTPTLLQVPDPRRQ